MPTVTTLLPRLTNARAPLVRSVAVQDETGARRTLPIAAERPLTLFVDTREVVTLMTLGAAPELLALGYLRNQGLVARVEDVESVTVDWDVSAGAVRTRHGAVDLAHKTARRIVTTGCGQGTVFGELMDHLGGVQLPPADEARISQRALVAMLERMRVQDSVYKQAGSVHGCALFCGEDMLMHVEDVGRHNAIDTIGGWMWMHGVAGADKAFYTTGRLTSEMVIKAAQMGVPIIVSRNGITHMGHELATRLGMALFGRAVNRHFICYSGFERFDAQPQGLQRVG
jgi:FdhD protein